MSTFTYVWSMEIPRTDVETALNDSLTRAALDSAGCLFEGTVTRVEQSVMFDFDRDSHHLTVEVTMEVDQ